MLVVGPVRKVYSDTQKGTFVRALKVAAERLDCLFSRFDLDSGFS